MGIPDSDILDSYILDPGVLESDIFGFWHSGFWDAEVGFEFSAELGANISSLKHLGKPSIFLKLCIDQNVMWQTRDYIKVDWT